MRVRTFHRHTVNRSSTILGALIPVHLCYSFCFTIPVFFIYLGLRWQRNDIDGGERAWMLCLLLVFTVVEAIRGILGYSANVKMVLPDLCGYMSLCLVPQLVIMAVLHARIPQRNDLEYAISVVQLMLLAIESLAAARMVWRLARNNTIDFYVALASNMKYY